MQMAAAQLGADAVIAQGHRGDFARLLRSSIAPYSPSSVPELLEVTEARAGSVLLILDGIDQVGECYRNELLDASLAFFEQYQCNVVISSSEPIAVPETIRGDTVVLEDLSLEDRRKIYAYYAPEGTPFFDLSAFPTAQDVKVAAQAAAGLSGNATPASVYDAYSRLAQEPEIASVGRKVCRRIARHVFDGNRRAKES